MMATRAQEVTQLIEGLLCKREDLSLDPHYLHKKAEQGDSNIQL